MKCTKKAGLAQFDKALIPFLNQKNRHSDKNAPHVGLVATTSHKKSLGGLNPPSPESADGDDALSEDSEELNDNGKCCKPPHHAKRGQLKPRTVISSGSGAIKININNDVSNIMNTTKNSHAIAERYDTSSLKVNGIEPHQYREVPARL